MQGGVHKIFCVFPPREPATLLLSIMVMPSEDDIRAGVGQVGGGNVTQPFVTETYRCVAQYETKDTKNKPFKVAVDEKVDVLIKDKAGERASLFGVLLMIEEEPTNPNTQRPLKRVFVLAQGGGWWRTRTSGWPGSLPPTWRG